MRLTHRQKQAICESEKKYFGADVRVWLFGSRVDDNSKGGDIDLYIELPMQDAACLIDAKLQFLRDLHKKIGEQSKRSISFCTETKRPSVRVADLSYRKANRSVIAMTSKESESLKKCDRHADLKGRKQCERQ